MAEHGPNWKEFPLAQDAQQDPTVKYDDVHGHYVNSTGGKPTETEPPASQMPNTPSPFGKEIAGK